ncbi:glycosyltransferase family 39 protein [Candidatus Curtissbacteria bacterium]|nr:glycosyltransferase family 39 protein [Candidatus Curtissbacteria bacterium]
MTGKFKKFVKKEPVFSLLVAVTIALAAFFRFYDYFDRVYIYSDHALFVQAAKWAFDNKTIPQIGPFVQAPFFTGPWWLWTLEIFFIFPFGVLTPWYLMSFLSFLFIYLIYRLGEEIGGKRLGITAAFLAAISPAQIDNSFATWNAAADPLLALIALILLLKFFETRRAIYAFFMGFVVSLAVTIHFQTVLLAPIILVALATSRPKLKNLFFLGLGGLIPLLPFLYFDLRFDWFEVRRIYDYLTIGQYRIYVPNRWLTYAGVYWPTSWGAIVGGNKYIGGLLIALLALFSLWRLGSWRRYKQSLRSSSFDELRTAGLKKFFLVAGAFALAVVMFRYYRGERFFYYSHFAHPAVIVLSAWTLLEVYKYKKIIGLLLAFVVVSFTFKEALANLKPRDMTLANITALKNEIYAKHPGEKFDIYGCVYSGALVSHPLAYVMDFEDRNSLDGLKIGVCQKEDRSFGWTEILPETLEGGSSPWLNESGENVYKTMTEWWKTKRPKFYYD